MKKFLSHLYVFILSSLLLFSDTRYLIASEEEMNLEIENYLYTKIPINCDLMVRKDGEGKLAGIKARKLNGYYFQRCEDGTSYEGFFKDGYFDGLGDYHLKNNHRYIGEFKYDRMHGAGIYINSEWITFGRFLKDSPAGQTIRYGCNRRTGYIYPVVKISKRAEYTDMRKIEFGETPAKSIIYNQSEMIRSTKVMLSNLYYYKGPIDGKCNNGLFEAIKSFSEDENIKSYYKEFFIYTTNNDVFRGTLIHASTYRTE